MISEAGERLAELAVCIFLQVIGARVNVLGKPEQEAGANSAKAE